ncbi:MAG: WD40-repeat-containing domain protein [Benniella sp.]|nr:MAG: WD40-repeat-containing domain protein [Benniella sp.]
MSLELANIYLDHAEKAQDPDIALVLCHDAEVSLFQAKRAAKHGDDLAVRQGIATAYIELGRALELRGHRNEAQAIFKKAAIGEHGQASQSFDTKSITPSTKSSVDTPPAKDQPSPLKKNIATNDIATIPAHIFAENAHPPTVAVKLPEPDERLINTPQLACCLALLKDSQQLEEILEPSARSWLQVTENDKDEHERLKVLAVDVIRTYKKEDIKDAKAVAEVVSLAPVLERDIFRDLLRSFYADIDHSGLLDIHQLQGLAQLVQGADTGYLDSDDLVKILGLLTVRLRETHQQSSQNIYQLTLAASYVLDAMADTKVEGLDRETLHEPLSAYLDALKGNSEPYLVYQAAYACQALLCVPDNESLWQATIRRTGKVIRGVSGLVSAVKGLDLNGFIDGLKDIQQGIAGASQVAHLVVTAFDGVTSMTEGGQGFLDGVKEGLSFKRKCAWYSALRGADTLIRDGEFASFKKLVCEAPCRLDPAFQWGVCQRPGEVASNPNWDLRTRRSATAFLGEMYRNEGAWGHQATIKEWIVIILMRLSSSAGSVQQYIQTTLQELEASIDAQEIISFQARQGKSRDTYPLKLDLPPLASPSLLDRVQNKPDVEGTLRQLRKQRLKEQGINVYIQPQAKASLKALDDEGFPLMEKIHQFLDSNQKVFLLLGDSGSGKSTFHLQLECQLWNDYKKNTGRIPLHISLPAIDKPEQDMIAKQLRKSEFTESEIRELKVHRKFILICDGYDESQQTRNLYTSNRLNQPGEWNAQMIISCRSEYIGVDYRDRFQPGDRNSRSDPAQFQEAVITPFTPDQVQDYIKQYVLIHQPLWEAKQYVQTLDLIPSLKELVRNPFLMTLSLEVLPRMVDPGEHLSATQVTRVALYDKFIEHWLERGKKRLSEKELSSQAKAAFESLVDEGFTQNGVDFLKKMAVAIYKEQGGQPVVKYSRFKDEETWKAEFFSRDEEKQLLREAIPLTRSGNQHRFIHRSLLEYGLTLAIFDPQDWKERPPPGTVSGRRGSTSSAFSFNIDTATEEEVTPIEQVPDINSPLAWRYFINEPSVLQFLCERVHQEPIFKKQLLDYIEYSKMDEKWRKAAANAITILVRAGVQFNGEDLRGIRIPGADLSNGMFDSTQFQEADLRMVTFRGARLQQADLSGSQMAAVQFGELPFIKEDVEVESCAYSPDGNSLGIALKNGDIKIYSTLDWKQTKTLTGHSERIRWIAFSPNGKRLVSGSWDLTVRLWDVESASCIHTLTGHDEGVFGVAYSPRGDSIASASYDKIVRVWNEGTGECRLILIGHTGPVLSVAFSPNGSQIASGGGDGTVRLWDVETGVCLHTLNGHVVDVETGTCCRVMGGHNGNIYTLSFSLQGDVIASAGSDNTVRLWDSETGTCREVLSGHSESVWCVVFSPNGDHVASASGGSTVRLWDARSGGTVARQIPVGHSGNISSVKYSPQGDQVASSSHDGTIRLWDVETGVCRRTLAGHTGWVGSIAFSPRGEMIVSASYDRTVKLWDVETGTCRKTLTGHDDEVLTVTYSPRGDQLVSGDRNGVVRTWDVETGECRHIMIGHSEWVTSILYSSKGNQIASSSEYGNTILLRDADSGACLHTLSGHDEGVRGIVYSPQGDVLASASDDKTVRLWDATTGECRYTLIGHSEWVMVIVYSPQGDQVASGDYGGSVRLWNAGTGECCHTFTGHTGMITGVIYSPKGDKIVTGSWDMTIRLWDVVSGQCQATIQTIDSPITSMAWDMAPDGYCFITGCQDGPVHMWRVVEHKGMSSIRPRWRPMKGGLIVKGASIQGVRGLSQLNEQLLKQRGAVGEPFVRLREASKKVMKMASVVSTLKKPSSKAVQDPSPSGDPSTDQSQQDKQEIDS